MVDQYPGDTANDNSDRNGLMRSATGKKGYGAAHFDAPEPARRKTTWAFRKSTRRKPRRWPLALRFIKGAIHSKIYPAVLLYALWAVLLVLIDQSIDHSLKLPNSITSSLSIVVGLMLVFRNQTSYNRFWDGRNHLTTIITSVRNLTRYFLVCSHKCEVIKETGCCKKLQPTPEQIQDTEATVRILTAILYATKNHLRAPWGAWLDRTTIQSRAPSPSPESNTSALPSGTRTPIFRSPLNKKQSFKAQQLRRRLELEEEAAWAEFRDLLPGSISLDTMSSAATDGVGLVLLLATHIQSYIKRSEARGWFPASQASQLDAQLNTLVAAYGAMETIRLTPIPVAHLIHQKQVLALYGLCLPFAFVGQGMGWLTVPVTCFLVFTLYGIEGIGEQLEDPFGRDRNDIKMDGVVEDIREEVAGLVGVWREGLRGGGDVAG